MTPTGHLGRATPGIRDRLIGCWRMCDWRLFRGDETLDPPLGPVDRLGGLLIYAPESLMSATLSVTSRPRFHDSSLDGGSDEEKAAAYDSIICYAGTFDVNEADSSVTHRVQYATFPNFVGQNLRRICTFDGDTLKLDTPPMAFGGEELASFILWERVR